MPSVERPVLYTTSLSANGRKVLAACKLMNIEPRVVEIDVYAGHGRDSSYLQLNPWGKIPTWKEGPFVLWESNAILQYLADAYGGTTLAPTHAQARADAARWLHWESAHFQPALIPILRDFVATALFQGRQSARSVGVQWASDRLLPMLAGLDGHLAKHPYLCGSALSVADLGVAGMFTYFRAARFPFADYPAVTTWYSKLEALAAWRDSDAPLWRAPHE